MTNPKETTEAVELLKRLIATPSVSRDETAAADIIQDFLERKSREMRGAFTVHRTNNNVWCVPADYDNTNNRNAGESGNFDYPNERNYGESEKNPPAILLNAHIDTVRPVAGWHRDPYTPTQEGDRLYGLGSNDCGGGLVALMQVFLRFMEPGGVDRSCREIADDTFVNKNGGQDISPLNSHNENLGQDIRPLNSHNENGGQDIRPLTSHNFPLTSPNFPTLIFLASAEEEVSGRNGIESVLPQLPPIDFAIVGEPTGMQPAIAEKGLMVIDAVAHGRAGHAARDEGDNAIYRAMQDIQWLSQWQFPKQTALLGPVKNTVTIVNAGTQHNVIPDRCTFTIDVRSNECYTNEEILGILRERLASDLTPRSTRLSSSRIDPAHPFVQACAAEGLTPFGSPTLSDQALMPFPSLKLGPGDSARSHTADEYIRISEIDHAVTLYKRLLDRMHNHALGQSVGT